MRRGMRRKRGLKVGCYTDRMIDLSEYLDVFPRGKIRKKVFVKDLSKTLLNSMPNSWNKHVYVQRFDYEYINFKVSVNMLECMEIE